MPANARFACTRDVVGQIYMDNGCQTVLLAATGLLSNLPRNKANLNITTNHHNRSEWSATASWPKQHHLQSVIFDKGSKTISADIGACMQSGEHVRLTGLNLWMRSDGTEKKQRMLSIDEGLDCCSCLQCPET